MSLNYRECILLAAAEINLHNTLRGYHICVAGPGIAHLTPWEEQQEQRHFFKPLTLSATQLTGDKKYVSELERKARQYS